MSTKKETFTAEERAAMRATAKEAKGPNNEQTLLERIAEMPEPERKMAKRVHDIVMAAAPELAPRTWYGMPAYAKDGKVVCFFRNASKFKERYAMLGFNDSAKLDDGTMWPVAYAIKELKPADEKTIRILVQKAVS